MIREIQATPRPPSHRDQSDRLPRYGFLGHALTRSQRQVHNPPAPAPFGCPRLLEDWSEVPLPIAGCALAKAAAAMPWLSLQSPPHDNGAAGWLNGPPHLSPLDRDHSK